MMLLPLSILFYFTLYTVLILHLVFFEVVYGGFFFTFDIMSHIFFFYKQNNLTFQSSLFLIFVSIFFTLSFQSFGSNRLVKMCYTCYTYLEILMTQSP